ncbi:O-antigen ligase family protein [Pedobacter sp. UC225_65]|uniref:O-antigen ligase family protein n=1 Tax=Pedobacter sp. UC225_65 TaxID=3350173 RepID=UPI00366E6787
MTETTLSSKVLLLLFFMVSLFTILHAQPLINHAYKIEFNTLVIVYFWMAIVACFLYVKEIWINKYDIFFFIITVNLLLITFINYDHRSDLSHIENVGYVFLIYLPVRVVMGLDHLTQKLKKELSILFIIALSIILAKSVLSTSWLNNINGGTFNSTYFSNYICLFVPLLYHIKKNILTNTWLNRAVDAIIICIIIICVVNQARASVIGLSIFILCQLNFREIYKQHKALLFAFLIGGFALLSYFLIGNKIASATGRLFIWENALSLIKEHPLGIGLGNFKQEYTVLQSRIISESSFNSKFLLADINDYAFNDLLQFIIEGGIQMIFLLMFLCYSILKSKNRLLISSTLLVFIISSTSYTLHSFHSFVIVIVLFCLFTKDEVSKRKISALFYIPTYIGFLWAILSFISYYSPKTEANNMYNNLLNSYRKLDNKYLYDWGAEEFKDGNFKESILLLKQSGIEDYDIDANLLLAQCYENINNMAAAEKHYVKANHILPRMFKPKHYLLKFYLSTNREKEIINIANEIIETPIKVSSNEILTLKKQATKILQNK